MGTVCCTFGEQSIKESIKESIDISLADYKSTPHVNYRVIKQGKVIKVVDGDTIWVAVDYYGQLCKFKIRLIGINTAELHEKKDEEEDQSIDAKSNRLAIAKDAKTFVYNLINDKIVDLDIYTGIKYNNRLAIDKNGRLLGKVAINGMDIGQELIKNGLAIEYDGGKKTAPKRK